MTYPSEMRVTNPSYQGQCQGNILIALYKLEIIDLETAA
jgi:hypothetical protein